MRKEAFKKIFDNYFDAVRNYIYYRSGDQELATDIAQDTFMKIWEKKNEVDEKKIKGLLFKIASDIFISRYRKDSHAQGYLNSLTLQEKSKTPHDDLEFKELKIKYENALAEMPEKQRIVFLMSRLDELKYHEIADRLQLSVKAVEKRMKNALAYLTQVLKE